MSDNIVSKPVEHNADETPITFGKPIEGEHYMEGAKGITEEPALILFDKIKGYPYAVEYFNIKGWEDLTPELDVNGIKAKVSFIEKFVQTKISSNQLENSVKSFDEVIGQILKSIGNSENELSQSKVNRVYNYIQYLLKIEDLDRQKNKFWEEAKPKIYG